MCLMSLSCTLTETITPSHHGDHLPLWRTGSNGRINTVNRRNEVHEERHTKALRWEKRRGPTEKVLHTSLSTGPAALRTYSPALSQYLHITPQLSLGLLGHPCCALLSHPRPQNHPHTSISIPVTSTLLSPPLVLLLKSHLLPGFTSTLRRSTHVMVVTIVNFPESRVAKETASLKGMSWKD